MHRSAVLATAVATAALLAPAAPAVADPPTSERITFGGTVPDEYLTEACGVDVTVTYSGVRILRSFGDEGNLRAVDTVNISLIATSEYGSYRFRDVGADVVKESPGGTLTVSIVGQLPFDYAGVLTIDLDTGELVREPRFRGDWQTERACDALTAD